ncbi:MAG TPA: dockerin [Verrucomicrobiae bacterium]|nr:dockerin [Verrucomicrobiae bacterium]
MRPTKEQFIRAMKTAGLCALLATSSAPAATPNPGTGVNLPWDWSGVIGTGQSLAVGEKGRPVLSRSQPYHNLKLSTGHLPWPIDPNDTNLTMVPLVEPIGRYSTNYPSSWPDNIAGETPHSAMANEITALVRAASGRDFIGVHEEVGENGQGMIYLKKNARHVGVNGRSYEAAMIETKAITRLAKAAGKTYGVGAIILTHGENDAGNKDYENGLYQLWSDYNTDLPAITGQKQKIQMIVSQQNSCNDRSPSTLAQWKIGVDHPADIVCSGPKYQYPSAEGIHLTANGYRELGEKYGQIYYERVVLGRDWQPLQPARVERQGAVITVHFQVPVAPLVWDTTFEPPHPSIEQWKNGKGFEVNAAGGDRVTIASVAISGDAVIINCASDPGSGARVGYAMVGEKVRMGAPFKGTYRWGLLRDSDPFIGAVTGKAQPNYSVAFEMPVP